jgi:hypothetical protein
MLVSLTVEEVVCCWNGARVSLGAKVLGDVFGESAEKEGLFDGWIGLERSLLQFCSKSGDCTRPSDLHCNMYIIQLQSRQGIPNQTAAAAKSSLL